MACVGNSLVFTTETTYQRPGQIDRWMDGQMYFIYPKLGNYRFTWRPFSSDVTIMVGRSNITSEFLLLKFNVQANKHRRLTVYQHVSTSLLVINQKDNRGTLYHHKKTPIKNHLYMSLLILLSVGVVIWQERSKINLAILAHTYLNLEVNHITYNEACNMKSFRSSDFTFWCSVIVCDIIFQNVYFCVPAGYI